MATVSVPTQLAKRLDRFGIDYAEVARRALEEALAKADLAARSTENRYFRTARVLVKHGDEISIDQLAQLAGVPRRTAYYGRDAFRAVKQVLLDAGWKPPRPTAD